MLSYVTALWFIFAQKNIVLPLELVGNWKFETVTMLGLVCMLDPPSAIRQMTSNWDGTSKSTGLQIMYNKISPTRLFINHLIKFGEFLDPLPFYCKAFMPITFLPGITQLTVLRNLWKVLITVYFKIIFSFFFNKKFLALNAKQFLRVL